MILIFVFASIDTKSFGVFTQKRIGYKAKEFIIFKIKTLKGVDENLMYISPVSKKISKFGLFLRRSNIDELPQLLNVLLGDMSIVGPRPDLKGFADVLPHKDQLFLEVKPGLTSQATLKYRNEEEKLSEQENPQLFYKTKIWPDKVRLNNDYVKNWSFLSDLNTIMQTIFS